MLTAPVEDWGLFRSFSPCVIAGPCSAESENQIMETARQLKAAGVCVLRAGLWKPRTFPGSFEGVGEEGLPWMVRAKKELGLGICTEVAGTKHIDVCLKAGMDLLWIGARTTVNPFLMQEIADALRGTDIPVLVKNPVNPDIGLWIGAFERLSRAGVRKLGAIHRGFTPEHKGVYRNEPLWDCPIELKSRFPNIPVFCDPSHIAGKAELVPDIAQKAVNLGMEGLMVESHCNPPEALSDAPQQLRSSEFGNFLSSINNKDNTSIHPGLESLRATIDSIDSGLLELLKERMSVSSKIGKYKKDNNIAIVQSSRWESVLTEVLGKGKALGLDEEMLRAVFNAIHKASVKAQD